MTVQPVCWARGDPKSQGCISTPSPTSCSLLPWNFPATGPSPVFLPPWSGMRRAWATRSGGTWNGAMVTGPLTRSLGTIPALPSTGERGSGQGVSGCKLDSSYKELNMWSCGLGQGASVLLRYELPTPQAPGGPRRQRKPGSGGALRPPPPPPGPLFPASPLARHGIVLHLGTAGAEPRTLP